MSDTEKAVSETEAAETPSIAELKEKAAKDVEKAASNGNSNNGDEVSNGEKHDEEEEEKPENGVNSSAEDDEEEAMETEEATEEEEDKVPNGEKTPEKSKEDPEDSSPVRRSSRKKSTPAKYQDELDVDEVIESEEEEINDVEEVKDEDDSDIMEVDAEDPLSGQDPLNSGKKKSTPNIVTIDDVKTLHKLANTAKQKAAEKEEKVVFIDTNSILAGRATSGVTITPARPKNAPPAVPAQGFGSGVTISQTSKSSTLTSASSSPASSSSGAKSSNATAFGYDAKGQLNDPNLTDDTFVVEAPSFIVPYVYEKPPKETIKDFCASIKELLEKRKKEDDEKKKDDEEKKKEEKTTKTRSGRKSRGKKPDSDDEGSSSESSEEFKDDEKDEDYDSTKEKKDSDDEIVEIKDKENEKPKNFFESSLGKFFFDLGMNFVQETVQADLLATQIKRSQKDKSAGVMHAIMSLKKNLEDSKETNEPFAMELKKCRFCSFKTESKMVMEHHLETPHMKMYMYRCNFCDFDTKMPQEVLGHMYSEHGIRGKLERAPAMHQCPQCPFEDNMKGKLTRHKTGCDKRFRHETNQQPPHDWEPPAKIPKPPVGVRGGAGGRLGSTLPVPGGQHYRTQNFGSLHMQPGKAKAGNIYSGMPQLQMGPRGRGRPVGSYKPGAPIPLTTQQIKQGLFPGGSRNNQNLFMNNQVVLQAINPSSRGGSSLLLPTSLGPSGSVTIQSINNRGGNSRGSSQPSISITPLPGGRSNSRGSSPQAALKPGQPGQNKASFVICEICDGYIKDLEQLRNHMQWIHKVKIHPKMIYNRPPLNCQKCQFRFFTDQGLERHLLGSHGLVTASMQDLANKGQDSGRCPVCGKVYQWKLLNHVAKDHQKTLKPAHLSYKCTVCTATFGQYKLFENHVYTAHSGASKKADKAKQQAPSSSSTSLLKTTAKLSDEITIIPQSKAAAAKAAEEASKSDKKSESADEESEKKESGDDEEKDPDVIELDDEEEIDDVEDEDDAENAEVINLDSSMRSSAQSSKQTSASTSKQNSDGEDENSKNSQDDEEEDEEEGPPAKRSKEEEEEEEEGVEEIEDEEEEG